METLLLSESLMFVWGMIIAQVVFSVIGLTIGVRGLRTENYYLADRRIDTMNLLITGSNLCMLVAVFTALGHL